MKKYLLIFTMAISGTFFLSQCNDLDLQPLDAISEDAFYKTAADFRGAILASYSSMQSFNGTSTENLGECAEWWKMTLMTTDDITFDDQNLSGNGACATNASMDNFSFTSSDKAFQSLFTHVYQGIFRANLVMDKLALENDLTAEEKALFTAEAKFLRAYFHFEAFKFWGGQSPLALETRRDVTDIALPNSTPDKMIQAIIDDFTAAAADLPESWDDSNLGRATAWAAKAYIGKAHLYNKAYGPAVTSFQEVYNMGPYQLMPTHEEVFSFDFENNIESIFEMQYAANSDDNGWVLDDNHSENFKASQGIMRAWWQDAGRGAPGGGLGINIPTAEIIAEFEAGDPRKLSTIYTDGDTYYADGVEETYDPVWSPSGATMKKYRGENVAKMNPVNFAIDYNNERLFRYADLILMYAEANAFNMGDAQLTVDLINEVRARSCPSCTPVSTSDDLVAAIQHERRVELAFEGHRLFDIVRWGIDGDYAAQGITFKTWGTSGIFPAIFPLPQSEIDRGGGILNQVN
ncbi:MAG: RagB/SusD family nutrient uptake outer membrane protein [Saprospiraceae bacterium]